MVDSFLTFRAHKITIIINNDKIIIVHNNITSLIVYGVQLGPTLLGNGMQFGHFIFGTQFGCSLKMVSNCWHQQILRNWNDALSGV